MIMDDSTVEVFRTSQERRAVLQIGSSVLEGMQGEYPKA